MKKLVWGICGLLLAANLAVAQPVIRELNNAPMPTMPPLPQFPAMAAIVPLPAAPTLPPVPPLPAPDLMNQDPQEDSGDPVKTKNFSKSFSVNGADKLSLSNKFGGITIKTWDKKEVKVDIDIKAYSNNAAEAQRLLEEVNIESGKSCDQIAFKTVFSSKDGNYGSGTRRGKVWRRELKINYVVYMPASTPLTVNNQYGGLSIGDFSGALYAKVQYGSFTAGNLASTNNYVDVQYGRADITGMNKGVIKQQYGAGLNLGTVGTLELDAQYVGVTINTIKGDASIKQQYGKGLNIGSVNNLELDAQYTNVNVTTINGNATVKQQYNNLTIGSVNKLKVNSGYVTVKVGTLKGDGDFNLAYNKLLVDNVLAGCKNLTVAGNYTGVTLAFASNYNADFVLKTSYGSFKPGTDVHAKLVSENGSTKNYEGRIGNGGNGNLNVRTSYGNISLN
ncbi:hypothetical protein OQX61_16465 [Pedobacter sp. PLR]|uniref:hypothetical protein n=1 Tax=Pedobacter sp. PLR TaxID=2994465 RepID=UPI0022472A3C|nr:hypothetical protein [Pedobacter sp. PLR]MCX2452871.1 hypothetical protein [Pedobacter sp. PLR]